MHFPWNNEGRDLYGGYGYFLDLHNKNDEIPQKTGIFVITIKVRLNVEIMCMPYTSLHPYPLRYLDIKKGYRYTKNPA